MAKFETNDLSALLLDMKDLENMPDSVLTDMVTAEQNVVLPAQQNAARSMGVRDTGALINSMKAKKPKRYKAGVAGYITFNGTRKRGKTTTRNAEIAFINEYGRHGQPARPFINRGNEQSADKAVDAAEKVFNDYLKSLNL